MSTSKPRRPRPARTAAERYGAMIWDALQQARAASQAVSGRTLETLLGLTPSQRQAGMRFVRHDLQVRHSQPVAFQQRAGYWLADDYAEIAPSIVRSTRITMGYLSGLVRLVEASAAKFPDRQRYLRAMIRRLEFTYTELDDMLAELDQLTTSGDLQPNGS